MICPWSNGAHLLRVRIRNVEQKALVAQRPKRSSSIINKLVREPDMKLSQMQDLGGCRTILSTVLAVNALYR
jgi:(p)ppGpp synthase/HD superfamily hydrolase